MNVLPLNVVSENVDLMWQYLAILFSSHLQADSLSLVAATICKAVADMQDCYWAIEMTMTACEPDRQPAFLRSKRLELEASCEIETPLVRIGSRQNVVELFAAKLHAAPILVTETGTDVIENIRRQGQ